MESTEGSEVPEKQSASDERMTICHLIDDCLENVFSYLSLRDLTNVADSNVHLAKSAAVVFKLKYGRNKIFYNYFQSNDEEKAKKDGEFSLMLEHFGSYMKKLRVAFCSDNNRNQLFFNAIQMNNFGANLLELSLENLQNTMVWNKIFPQLQKLVLLESYFGIHPSFVEINKWFPQLSSLQVDNVFKFWENNSIDQFIPKLQDFTYLSFPGKHTSDSARKLALFLKSNPQLKRLGLDELGDDKARQQFYQNAPEEFPNIERLEVVSPHPYPNGPVQFNNLKELKLSFFADTSDITEHLPKTIECLELRVPSLSASKLNMVLNCQQLKKLKLELNSDLELSQMESLANGMKSLTEVHFVLNVRQDLSEPQTLVALEQFFVNAEQMETISLKYEVMAMKLSDPLYSKQIDIASQFTKTINDSTKSNWKLSHIIQMTKGDSRSRELASYPWLQLIFKKN